MEPKKEEQKVYSVTDLNLYVKALLTRDENLQGIWIRGEISGFTHHQGRHMYFQLKDEKSQLRCAMFENANRTLDFIPEEGMDVMCKGNVTIYTARGEYQIIVTEMLAGGLGTLYLAFEKLKKRLHEEGLFDEKHKKPIPILPGKVGIVTSEDGAALRDILSVIKRRFSNMDVLIMPTPVQGKGAAEKIAEGIGIIDTKDVDVIIVSRGGGSIEDLWCFNEEVVARAIFKAETPVISAVGHETDFLISDFVADLRAPTPSAAAERAVPSKSKMLKTLLDERRRCAYALNNMVSEYRTRLLRITKSPVFRRPKMLLEDFIQTLDEDIEKLNRNITALLSEYKHQLKNQRERLRALGPEEVMKRGYSVITQPSGELITSISEVSVGDILEIKLTDGEIDSVVKEVKRWKKK